MVEQGKEDATEFHPAPVWLDKPYLERLLRDLKNDPGLRITDLLIKPATAKGDNYSSVMTRVRILFLKSGAKNPETEYYIVKTTYENDGFAFGIFSQYQTRQPEKVFAKTLHVDYEHEAIIFEDLAVTEYVLADRLVGLDLEHTRLGLRKLAKMHAAAAVLNERQPGLLTKFDHGIFNRHTQAFAPCFVNMVGVAADFARECPELGERYANKLKKLQERVMEYCTRVYDPQPGDFNTLVHGDYWVNNVMLRYGENKEPLDMTLIDFQFCSWSSPAVDLHYFFNTSVQFEIRYEQQDALFQYYHTVLVDTLKDLNFGGYIPTLRQFVLQLERARFFAVTVAMVFQAILTNDQNADADFNALMKDDERGRNFRKVLYTNKRLQDNLKRELPRFDRIGLLDIID
ncbi:GM17735 [Drosophila sechellia]|uniref:GM17735 n=1 Tax=Drosophila sechellia TaxID=7238 RepID=B4IJK3_DROSE|nr:GM17735 [Drosophila sechellia]